MNKSTYEYEYSMRLEGERDTPIYCTEYTLVLGLLVWTAMDQIRAYAVEIEMSPSKHSQSVSIDCLLCLQDLIKRTLLIV